jgi:hypothetical protein
VFSESIRYVVTALLLFAATAAGPAAPRLKDTGPTVPRDFTGRFGFYTVALKIDTVQERDGLIRFTGTHAYAPGDYTMKVEGTIDRKTRRVSLRESEPSRANADTDGSFEGAIAEDFRAIDAVWTPNGSKNSGELKLKATKAKD